MNNATIITDANWEEMIEAVSRQVDFSDEQIEKGAMDKIANSSQDGMTFGDYLEIAKEFAEAWAE